MKTRFLFDRLEWDQRDGRKVSGCNIHGMTVGNWVVSFRMIVRFSCSMIASTGCGYRLWTLWELRLARDKANAKPQPNFLTVC